ncbi:hypothetical protein [Terrihabitans rhizophilus]|jgi:hypothetical protein|uniref:DUF3405 domain-containing protein n=1 Tax=Terrihabitans rhizophilus TaxID=3092662 RepID=A0ABU4RPC7_9HYPH|nr:hypothetical protein [Terrihabitans sp. PJ23]MDX6805555.1 hypothetical protein [Terrihabitans sp. PJ23]
MSQAVLFLTHLRTPRVLAHFERLRAEAGPVLPVFLGADDTAHVQLPPPGPQADFQVCVEATQAMFPGLYPDYAPGRTDLIFLTMLMDPRLRAFDHVWIMEYDVDYSGDWSEFFKGFENRRGDLVATRITHRSRHSTWFHWRDFASPPSVPESRHIYAFMPMVRLSRAFITAYIEARRRDLWQGHYEAILPSFALDAGFHIVDMGYGPYGSFFRRRLYRRRTFRFRPARPNYFHEVPAQFPLRSVLYHPVKL